MVHELSPRMKLLFQLDLMRRRLHNYTAGYLVSKIPITFVFDPQQVRTDEDLHKYLLAECMELFHYTELIFDVVSDDELYELNSYSDGIDGVIQRRFEYPKPEFFTLLCGLYTIRLQLASEENLIYDLSRQFRIARLCPSLSTTNKKSMLYRLAGQTVYLLREILCQESRHWRDQCVLRHVVHAN